ncbi:UPF0147 family protein [Candidatus Woesearchaeota archaeon]|nr:UPF0147 family protein [Candidatus Woesearchaeota archaeon]
MSSNPLIDEAIEKLREFAEDSNIAKNVKSRIDHIISILEDNTEISIKTNKALNELDEISNDPNLESYTRPQLWNIVSILEKINH